MMKPILKLTADQLEKVNLIDKALSDIDTAHKKYDRVLWNEKRDKLFKACHDCDNVKKAIDTVDEAAAHDAYGTLSDAVRSQAGILLNSLYRGVRDRQMRPLVEPILGKASVAAGKLADKTEEKEMAEAVDLGVHYAKSPKVLAIRQRQQALRDLSKDMGKGAPRHCLLDWLAGHWITA